MAERLLLGGAPARAAILRGMETLTGALRPTLGPVARTVAVARDPRTKPPEILDDAATIARRTIQLADPFADLGGMIARQLVWRAVAAAGDGGATAAVLAQGLMRAGAAAIAAGCGPMPLKRGIERGLAAARAELRRQARAVDTPGQLASVVAGIVRDPDLAALIGEIVDAVGPDGAVIVEDGASTRTECAFIDGVHWNQGYASHYLLRPGETTARLLDPRIFLTDHPLERAEQLLPAVEACRAAGGRALLVIAPEVRDAALALLIVNRDRGVLDGALAVRAPVAGPDRAAILDDLAVITGGRCLARDRRDRPEAVTGDDLGAARQAAATNAAFSILGGRGDRGAIRARIGRLKAELREAADEGARDRIRERIGKLAGTAAVIRVGAATASARAERTLRIEAAVRAARAAAGEGVVPGGGAALLACAPALEGLPATGDEAAGLRALALALAEPLRAIAENAGLEPGPIAAEARRRGPGWAFDVVGRAWVDAGTAGLVDPLGVTLTALETGVSAATMALTTDVLVRHRRPEIAAEP